MDINEMKNLWIDMSSKLDRQIELSEQVILQSTEKRFSKKVNIFWNSQILGFIVAYGIITLLAFNFYKLETWQEVSSAILWTIYLGAMPFYSIAGIKALQTIDIQKTSFRENFHAYVKGKNRIFKAQKISLILNPVLFVAAIILSTKLLLEIDSSILLGNPFTVIILAIALLGTMAATYWVYKKNNIYLESLQEFIKEE